MMSVVGSVALILVLAQFISSNGELLETANEAEKDVLFSTNHVLDESKVHEKQGELMVSYKVS